MKAVAIIGGGFCGAVCARILEKKLPEGYSLILFDRKKDFEYTPSVHKLITDVDYEKRITVPYSRFLKRAKIINDEIVSVSAVEKSIKTKQAGYMFDYLVACSGSVTPKPNIINAFVLKSVNDAHAIREKFSAVKNVIIVGGGFTGVEIAGELATKTDKKIEIVHAGKRLLDRLPESVSVKAQRFLERKGVSVRLNESRDKFDCDLVIWSAGIKAETYFIEGFPLNDRGCVQVDLNLRVKGYDNIFAGGDIADLPEEKCAQNAQIHGRIIAENVINSISKKKLVEYAPKKRIMVVSLGDYYSIMAFPDFVLSGIIPSMIKKMIEIMVVRGTSGR